MTENNAHNRVSAGLGSDFRVAAVGALMPFGAGMLGLVGYELLGPLGIIVAIAGCVWWAIWWYRRHRAFFPRDVHTRPFIVTIIITAVALILALASS